MRSRIDTRAAYTNDGSPDDVYNGQRVFDFLKRMSRSELPGSYVWTGNNRHGDNHRRLAISPAPSGSYTFKLTRVRSAGGAGSAGDTVQGRIDEETDGRLFLIGETTENWASDTEPGVWSQTRPSTDRWALTLLRGSQIDVGGDVYQKQRRQ